MLYLASDAVGSRAMTATYAADMPVYERHVGDADDAASAA